MNNKPVAWIDPYDLERLPHHDCWVNGQEHKNSVPLYIYPVKELKNIVLASATCSCGKVMEVTNLQAVKELTDEEILSCWDGVDPPEECWITDEHRIMFARAVLRKASEK